MARVKYIHAVSNSELLIHGQTKSMLPVFPATRCFVYSSCVASASYDSMCCFLFQECPAAFVFFRTRYAAACAAKALQSSNPMIWCWCWCQAHESYATTCLEASIVLDLLVLIDKNKNVGSKSFILTLMNQK
jgi:hypothetical protein